MFCHKPSNYYSLRIVLTANVQISRDKLTLTFELCEKNILNGYISKVKLDNYLVHIRTYALHILCTASYEKIKRLTETCISPLVLCGWSLRPSKDIIIGT